MVVAALAAPVAVRPDTVAVRFAITDLPLGIQILFSFAVVNLFLGLFNLLPIPPLDGSALLERVLPGRVAPALVQVPAVRLPRAVPARVLDRRSSASSSSRSSNRLIDFVFRDPGDEGCVHLVRPLRAGAVAGRRRAPTTSRGSESVLTPDGLRAVAAASPTTTSATRSASPATCRRASPAPSTPTTRAGSSAALLHDIGKLDARLGVYGRVVATVSGAAAGREHADAWSESSGFTRRVGLYLRHAELGGRPHPPRGRARGGGALGGRPPRPRQLGRRSPIPDAGDRRARRRRQRLTPPAVERRRGASRDSAGRSA